MPTLTAAEDERPFPIGHPELRFTQLPARDAVARGAKIERSNRFPNNSYFLGWTSVEDTITWQAEVAVAGTYEVEMYYACPQDSIGATIELRMNGAALKAQIQHAHDPPQRGQEHDRVARQESYIKDFRPMKLGRIELKKGPGPLTLRALNVPGEQVAEFRLLMFRRVSPFAPRK